MDAIVDDYFYSLLQTLSDESDKIVLMDLTVLALVCRTPQLFSRVMTKIVELLGSDRELLERRGAFIIRHLCLMLSPEEVFSELARIIEAESDDNAEFASVMVQVLNLILLSAEELEPLRTKFVCCFSPSARDSGAQKGKEQAGNNRPGDLPGLEAKAARSLFRSLYNCWCVSPVSALSLCFLAQAYELAVALIERFAQVQVTVGFLMQMDKLVQLIESPIFVHLRLQMLQVNQPHHTHLMKALYGLLMVLPQSSAFQTLRNRLSTVASLCSSTNMSSTTADTRSNDGPTNDVFNEMIKHFVEVQEKLRAARFEALANAAAQ